MALQNLSIGNNFSSKFSRYHYCNYGINFRTNQPYEFSRDKNLWKLKIDNIETNLFDVYRFNDGNVSICFKEDLIQSLKAESEVAIEISVPVINSDKVTVNTVKYSIKPNLGVYNGRKLHLMTGAFSCTYNGTPFTADIDAFYDHSPSSNYYDLSCNKLEDGTTEVFLAGMDKASFEIYDKDTHTTKYCDYATSTISLPVAMLDDNSINKFGDTIVTNSLGKQSIKSLMGTVKCVKIKARNQSTQEQNEFLGDLYFVTGEENRDLITDGDKQFKLQYIRVVYCQDGSISGSVALPINENIVYDVYVVFE